MTITGFKRKAVLDATREAIANLEQSVSAWDKRAEEIRTADRERWLREDLPRVRQFRDQLTAALKKGGTINRSDFSLEKLLYREMDDFAVGHKIGYRDRSQRAVTNERIIAYMGVVKLLEAQEGEDDDVLSLAALKNLGINKLGELFRAAADRGGSVDKAPI